MEALTNIDAERTVLGCALSDPGALFRILPLLKAEDFSLDSHRRIFHAMKEMANTGKQVDDLTICDALAVCPRDTGFLAVGRLNADGRLAISANTDSATIIYKPAIL